MDATRRRRIGRRGGASAPPVILAILAGQSNWEGGRYSDTPVREAQDVATSSRCWQFVGFSGAAGYRTITATIGPLQHYAGWVAQGLDPDSIGPGESFMRQLAADNPTTDVVAVPCARGSSAKAQPGDPWYPHATAGGVLFENMVTQANLAYTACQAQFPGRPITVMFTDCQGEGDAGAGTSRAAYLAAETSFIALARSRVTGASNAKFVLCSIIPRLWDLASPNYQAAYAAINAAHVDASVDIANVRYVRGASGIIAGDTPGTHSTDFLHYSPKPVIRALGLRAAAALTDAAGPTMTSPATAGTTVGDQLALPLTCNDEHATFHIVGGAGAANYEISDRYLSPTLRWTGNGTGPAVGFYVVQIAARDGSGNYGAPQTHTTTVANAYGIGDQGPVTAAWVDFVQDLNTHTGSASFTVPNFPVGVGMNLIRITTEGGSADVTAITINGRAASKLTSGTGGTVFGYISSVAGSYIAGIDTGGGNGAVVNTGFAIVLMTGTKATPQTTDKVQNGFVVGPVTGASLTCPADGMIVGIGNIANAGTAGTGCTALGTEGSMFAARRSTTGAISFNGDADYSGVTSLAWEKSV